MGNIEIIVGSMFSGKTEEFIRRLKRATIARQVVQAFKPTLDDRYHATDISSHDHSTFAAKTIVRSVDLLSAIHTSTNVVGIDEVQFFDEGIVAVVESLSRKNIRVIMAGLDTDWQGQPFGPTPNLMAIADAVTKLTAICVVCSQPANRTQRLVGNSEQIVVGAADQYEARCRACHDPMLAYGRARSESHNLTSKGLL